MYRGRQFIETLCLHLPLTLSIQLFDLGMVLVGPNRLKAILKISQGIGTSRRTRKP